jgi:hypothetical protein
MSKNTFSKIFVIGGTGAQGLPIIKSLVSDSAYSVRILTRDTTSGRAKSLAALSPNVELVRGSFTNEADLRAGYAGCDAAFVNIDGFNTGEASELFWAIRCYELAVENGGIKFFVYGNLDYAYKLSGYNPNMRAGHYDGKGRIGEWILSQAKEAAAKKKDAMSVALFTTGPYIDMAISSNTLMTPTVEKDDKGDDVVTWRVPLADGEVAHVALEDCGPYVRRLFDHPERANGMDLQVAIDHITYHDVAAAFTKVTGKPARFIDVSMDWYWNEGPLSHVAEYPAAYATSAKDPSAMNIRNNFTGFWNIWRGSAGNKGVIRRDYKLLDEILPNRIRTVEEWFRREEQRGRAEGKGGLWDRVQEGKMVPILKLHEDGMRLHAANL